MLRVLIVGCGNIAGRFDEGRPVDAPPLSHAGAYRSHRGFVVTACIDPDDKRRQHFQEYWNVKTGVGSWGDLKAAAGAFDVISICSPTAYHSTDLAAALALGPRLVFAEKPLTGSAAETAEWVRRYREAGVLLAVNYTRRWAPDVIDLARDLKAGHNGSLRSVSGVYTKGVVHNGSHMIDLLRHLLGEVELIATGEPVHDFWPEDASTPALLRTASGVPITLNIGNAADFALFEMRLVTANGIIEMADGGMNWTIREASDDATFPGYRSLRPARLEAGRYPEAMLAAATNIAEVLDGKGILACTGETALTTQVLCDKIKAAWPGHPLSVS